MTHDEHIVTINLSGMLAFTGEITLDQAGKIISFIASRSQLGGPAGRPTLSSDTTIAEHSAAFSNPREALEASGAKKNPEKIVAFAVYTVRQSGKNAFGQEDVKPLFHQAREATPRNLSRDLAAAIKAGWVAESDVKGAFYVTNKGETAFEAGFAAAVKTKPGSGKTKGASRRSKKVASGPPECFQNVDITPTIDGYVGYHQLGKATDRLIWALNAAKMSGIEALTNQEVVWLTDHLGVGISTNVMTSTFRSARRANRVNLSTQTGKMRISADGEIYLKGLASKDAK